MLLMYILGAIYSETAERRRLAATQDILEMRSVFSDLKTRLEAEFTFTKAQRVSNVATLSCLVTEVKVTTDQYTGHYQGPDVPGNTYQLYRYEHGC